MWYIPTLCLLILPYIQAQGVIVTNGTSGERCRVKKCLRDVADCVGGDTCVCRPPRTLDVRNGHFGCYRTNYVAAEGFSDPKIRSFNNQKVDFPYFCRYLLSSVTTNLRLNKKNVGNCFCQVHPFNHKDIGKFYIGGVDMACQINNTERGEHLDFATRVVGLAENGVYTYREEGVAAFLPDGPFDPTPVDISAAGVHVRSYVDHNNNQFVLAIPPCGVIMTFVAYDVKLRRAQDQIPGISFAVSCALAPKFRDHDRVIAPAPVKFGGKLYEDLPGVPPLTVTQALLIRAFRSNVAQTQPDAAPQCASIGGYLNLCTEENQQLAAQHCFWMTQKPKFARCLSGGNNIEPVANIFDMCVSHFCVGYPTCDEFVDIILATNCADIPDISDLDDIVSREICNR